jgi:hypothetical protein
MRRKRTCLAIGGSEGAVSVELIGILPALLLAFLIAAQVAAAGHALWSAAIAARAGSRAAIVGEDGARAARRALPRFLRGQARVDDSEGVSVEVEVPRVVPMLPRIDVGARTTLPEAGDG